MPPKTQSQQGSAWGRNHGKDLKSILEVSFLFLFAPGLVVYYFMACDSFDCSLSAPVVQLMGGELSFAQLIEYVETGFGGFDFF